MELVSNTPLVFLDRRNIDELSVHFRDCHHRLAKAFETLGTEFTSLADLCDGERSITYGILKAGDYVEDGVPMIKVEDMLTDGTIRTNDLMLVSTAIASSFSRTCLRGGELLVSIKGTIGRVCVVPHELAGGNISRDSALIPLRDKDWTDFVKIFLESDLGQLQMTLHSRGAATKGINLEDLRQVRFPSISRSTRDQITQRFSIVAKTASDLVAQAASIEDIRLRKLESLDAVYAAHLGLKTFPTPWFGRLYLLGTHKQDDRFDVLGANTSFCDQCEATKVFQPLSHVCDVDGSNEQIPIGNQRYLAIDECPGRFWGDVDPRDVDIESSTARKRFNVGDIAWAHLKPSILQGKVFIINEPCWGSHHFLSLRTALLSDDYRLVIWAYFKLPPVMRHLANQCTGKSQSQKDVSAAQLATLPFPILDKAQIAQIAIEIRRRIAETDVLKVRANELRQRARQLLVAANENIVALLDDQHLQQVLEFAGNVKRHRPENEVA